MSYQTLAPWMDDTRMLTWTLIITFILFYDYDYYFMLIYFQQNVVQSWDAPPLLYEIPNYSFMKCHNYYNTITFFASYISLDSSSYVLSNFTPLMAIISIEPYLLSS